MRINAVHALMSLLQQQSSIAGLQGRKTVALASLVEELKTATDTESKLSIINRIQKELGVSSTPSAPPVQAAAGLNEMSAEEAAPAWRMSHASTESINGLPQQHGARQWELDTVLQALLNSDALERAGGAGPGLATPFRPTADDVEKAIESLGLSSRQLFREEMGEARQPLDLSLWPDVLQRLLPLSVGLALLFVVVLYL